jgi:hypothetical protein
MKIIFLIKQHWVAEVKTFFAQRRYGRGERPAAALDARGRGGERSRRATSPEAPSRVTGGSAIRETEGVRLVALENGVPFAAP